MKYLDLEFEKVFKITTFSMHLNRSHPGISRNNEWICQFIPIISISIFSALLLFNSVLFHDLPNAKYAEASKNISMAIVALIINYKYFILLYHQKSISVLIENINKDYKLAMGFSNDEKAVILKYSQKGVRVSKFWVVSAFGTCFIFVVKSILLMCYYYFNGRFQLVPMFDFTYPDLIETRKHEFPMFGFCYLLCLCFDSYAATMYLGFDPLVPIFMLHSCGQLELLSKKISQLFSEDSNPKQLQNQLKIIIIKLQDIYSFVDRVKHNFSFLNEFVMKTTTILLPLTAFQILEDFRNKKLNIEFISFFTGVILHFYMPCYYSDLLMEKNEHFRQAIYACGWQNEPNKSVRQIILFMLTRTSRPLGITTVFYNISLDTFSEVMIMCRQAYGIFNVMNAAWA